MEKGTQKAWGILLLALCLSIGMSLFSYDWQDIGALKVPPNDPPSNLIGPVGAWMSYVLLMGFGVGAYVVPVWCLALGLMLLLNSDEKVWPRALWMLITALSLMAFLDLCESWCASTCRQLNIAETAGLFGRLVTRDLLVRWLSPVGAGILLGTLFVVSVVVLVEMRNIVRASHYLWGIVMAMTDKYRSRREERQEQFEKIQEQREKTEEETRQSEKRRQRRERVMQDSGKETTPLGIETAVTPPPKPEPARSTRAKPAPEVQPAVEPEPAVVPVAVEEPVKKKEPPAKKAAPAKEEPPVERPVTAAKLPGASTYQLPPLSLLNEPKSFPNREITTDSGVTSKILVETLAEFGIEAETTNVEKGPVVTRYELLPAPGVRVEKISALSNNIALALKATSVRVQAPIPGKGVVGIEVPNSTATMIYLREILEGPTWQSGKAKLPLVLGQDVGGNDLIADLAVMPHLLVAGATGSGKTVCMNSILTGLLMSRTPDQLRLMLVDPKIVEFSVYESIPHLVVPVITNPKKVALGLRWAINEMEKRYKLFAKVGVRNIESYNSREIAKQEVLFEEPAGGEEKKDNEPPAKIPYIVIVIDELADLMLVDQAEIENAVARLAQLSRAVGIHMIISTQRPSVNVITGTIKANFPSRIAFQVAQKTDSRTILDGIGAEKLLGRGDMLFLPPGSSKMIRAQGVMTTDEEIKKVADFIRTQGAPDYAMEIKDKLEKPTSKLDEGGEEDELVEQAVQIIRETQRASTSSLQRRLRIGYTRAARIMDILEERGIVGPPRGSDAREIMVDLDGEIADNNRQPEEKTE
jgi:S-DNA-T family DNA segregation ATPase FtsK/SpoIIIE